MTEISVDVLADFLFNFLRFRSICFDVLPLDELDERENKDIALFKQFILTQE